MANTIERRHDIGDREYDQKHQSQNSGCAKGSFRFTTEGGEVQSPILHAVVPDRSGPFKPFKVPAAIDVAASINDCPAEIDPGAVSWRRSRRYFLGALLDDRHCAF